MCFSLYLKFETNIFLKLLVLETKKKRRGEERQRQREEILNLVKSIIYNPYSAININNNVVSYFVSILQAWTKITDFGMARMFVLDQSEGSTSRIVGA